MVISFHSSGKCYAIFQKKRQSKVTPIWDAMNPKSDQYGNICPNLYEWHLYIKSNLYLTNWDLRQTQQKINHVWNYKLMVTNYSWLVRSFTQEGNHPSKILALIVYLDKQIIVCISYFFPNSFFIWSGANLYLNCIDQLIMVYLAPVDASPTKCLHISLQNIMEVGIQ